MKIIPSYGEDLLGDPALRAGWWPVICHPAKAEQAKAAAMNALVASVEAHETVTSRSPIEMYSGGLQLLEAIEGQSGGCRELIEELARREAANEPAVVICAYCEFFDPIAELPDGG